MKQKTVIIIGAGAAIALGYYLYTRKKAEAATDAATAPIPEVQAAVDQIQMPVASDVLPVSLPPSLLQPNGNTGIVAPAVAPVPTPVPTIAPATAPSVVKALPTSTSPLVPLTPAKTALPSPTVAAAKVTTTQQAANLMLQKIGLKGLSGTAYLMN